MAEQLATIVDPPLSVAQAIVPIGLSLVASVFAYLMYQWFYGSTHIGAGVHRSFILGGPAITMIFLVIQASIPLGMGVLGTLSFVRFRTPIKDPAEVGFLLLLIGSSIGMATGNYLPILLLFIVSCAALMVQQLLRNRAGLAGTGHLMISVDRSAFPALEGKLTGFLGQQLPRLSLETMSTMDGKVGLHYQYRRKPRFDWVAFANDLNQLAGEAEVDVFIG